MKRNVILGIVLLALVAGAAQAAQPFGQFGGIVGGGNSGTGLIALHGWALDAPTTAARGRASPRSTPTIPTRRSPASPSSSTPPAT
jgi:hypothetical protein